MAYKFQLGAFVASGSILAEDKMTSTDDMITRGDLYSSGSLYVPQSQKLVLDNDKDSYILATGDDEVEIVTGGDKIGLQVSNTAAKLGQGGVHAVDIDSGGGASAFHMKASEAAALDIKQRGGASYLKFDTSAAAVVVGQQMSGAAGSFTQLAVDHLRFDEYSIGTSADGDLMQLATNKVSVAGEVSASTDLVGHHAKARQISIGYDGVGGAEGHLTLGAGQDLQFGVFSDHGVMMNNTAEKDLKFQIKTAGGDNIQPLQVQGSDHAVRINKLNLSGSTVTSTAAELNVLASSGLAASDMSTLAGLALDGVGGLVQADFTKLAALDATAAELNIVDGGTSATATTIADADRLVLNDNGTMVQVAMTDFETYFEGALDTLSNVTTVGALNAGSITSGFGDINIGSNSFTGRHLTLSGDLHVQGVTTTIETANLEVKDSLIGLGFTSGSVASAVGDRGLILGLASENNVSMYWDESDSQFAFVTTDSAPDATAVNPVAYANVRAGYITAAGVSAPMLVQLETQANGAIDLSAAEGKTVVVTDALAANRSTALPSSPEVGDQIDIKLHQAAGYRLTIEKGADGHSIDGGDSVILESDYAAIKLVYVAANDWRVF